MTFAFRHALLPALLLSMTTAAAETAPSPAEAGLVATSAADVTPAAAPTVEADIAALLAPSVAPVGPAGEEPNWSQWAEAEASARAVVEGPILAWGLLPDPLPDNYTALPLLDDGQHEGHYGTATPWSVQGEIYRIRTLTLGQRQEGITSWYGPGFNGRPTASGEIFDMHQLTAAHRTLPLPSYIRVTNLANDQSVIVKVNDRGPYHGNRMLDLSYAAARKLGIQGTGRVSIEPVEDAGNFRGSARKGTPLARSTVHSVLLGNFSDSDQAHALQGRLMARLPAGIPVTINRTKAPLQIDRVEVGPLLSMLEVNLLIRSMRAVRMGLIVDTPRVRGR